MTHREDDRYGGQVQKEQRKTGGAAEGWRVPTQLVSSEQFPRGFLP